MLVLILVGVVSVLATALYFLLDSRYSVWKRKGVPGPPAAVSLVVPKVRPYHRISENKKQIYFLKNYV